MLIKYKDFNFKEATLQIISQANEIIEAYEADGYLLTLRQLYYQFVARGLIENSVKSYNRLGDIITNARLAGMVSWESIEDRNREHHEYQFEEDASSVVSDLEYYIHFDYWARQDTYVEVWVEKDALGSVVERACRPYRVPFMACKGYLSASEAWRAGQRFKEKIDEGKDAVLIHLGDHDPSGVDMTRDNADRLQLFTDGLGVDVQRVALNLDQIEQYDPPPNPAKIKDPRAEKYIEKFGNISWELDALEPRVIEKTIQDAVVPYIDQQAWQDTKEEEAQERRILKNLDDRWGEVRDFLEGYDD